MREKETDRQTDRQTQTQTDRQTDRECRCLLYAVFHEVDVRHKLPRAITQIQIRLLG